MKATFSDMKRFFAKSKNVLPDFNTPVRYRLQKPTLLNRVDALLAPEKFPIQDLILIVTERVIEYPFVFRNLLPQKGNKVLDFGCAESLLSYQLLSNGYLVTGVDLRDYHIPLKNFKFIQGDIFDIEWTENEFDAVTAISAVEHIGLSGYGNIPQDDQTDLRALKVFSQILKPGGQLLLTVPAGACGENAFFRVYDDTRLDKILSGFEIDRIEYYAKYDSCEWQQVDASEISKYSWIDKYNGNGAFGVACVSARVNKHSS